jgi:puromycin-sensitive aminopeptidase
MFDQETSISAAEALEYRLPPNVTPSRYDLTLTPDLKAFTFDGTEIVAITVHEATADIVLNALELEIDGAVAERGGKSLAAQVDPEPARERVRFHFGEPLEPGEWTLRIKFRGVLNDKLHGFYRSQYTDAAGKLHTVATTQFEATDARRAIPCWDEPALKAVFGVTLIVDEDLTALSNAGIKSERKLGGGKKEVVFKDTIKMSTYLLAFIIGEFEATATVDAGTPLRVVHVPGKRALTGWAEQIGAFSLKFFADYYGIPYPGDKLDLIAIPDFAAGAMENLGAITFRETALLADQHAASRAELERVADVVSHENAHMWFGDLVTMRWWNGIWLNEAFATFMEMLAVDAWKPQWKRWESFGVSRGAAMAIDALKSTRSIEYTVLSPEDCRSMFDVLTYEKGAAVLRMLEQFLGAEVFRKGISGYLKKHQYNNTETGDLWDALEAASGQPVRSMMDTWIFQQGFPVVSAAPTADGHGLKITQRRFFFAPPENPEPQLWHVPVMIRACTDKGVETHKLLLTEAETTLQLPGKVEWALLNEGGHGFYRVRYSPELLAALTKNHGVLKPIERYGLVSDTWAATVAGLTPLAEFIKMARLFRDETDINVWRALIGAFAYLDMIATERSGWRLPPRFAKSLVPPPRAWDGRPLKVKTNYRGSCERRSLMRWVRLERIRRYRRALANSTTPGSRIPPRPIATCSLRSSVSSRIRGTQRAIKNSRNTLSRRARRRKSSGTCSRWRISAISPVAEDHGDDAERRGAYAKRAVPAAFAPRQQRLPNRSVGVYQAQLGDYRGQIPRQRATANV